MKKIVIGAVGAIALALCAATPARADLRMYEWRTEKNLITFFSISNLKTQNTYIEYKDIQSILTEESNQKSKL
jgi:hypothetical protein